MVRPHLFHFLRAIALTRSRGDRSPTTAPFSRKQRSDLPPWKSRGSFFSGRRPFFREHSLVREEPFAKSQGRSRSPKARSISITALLLSAPRSALISITALLLSTPRSALTYRAGRMSHKPSSSPLRTLSGRQKGELVRDEPFAMTHAGADLVLEGAGICASPVAFGTGTILSILARTRI